MLSGRPASRRRVRRRANSASNDPAEQLTEMSVRGLNLFRYASVNEGVYQCTECAKENIQKTFKNKYSFQRHAFLYHEGQQRKVFPCPVCSKEFSRPDKMKNHMKTTHEYYVPKDYYNFIYEEVNDSPVITLEVMSDVTSENSSSDNLKELKLNTEGHEVVPETVTNSNISTTTEVIIEDKDKDKDTEETPKARGDLLEYMLRNDGSVVCKLCGEILQSRTHWYRHKYKLHVIQPLNPAPLFQCEQCLVYFKSRKGYIGHLASRHSDILSDSSPVLSNSQEEAIKETSTQQNKSPELEQEPDPELAIPKTSVPNYQTATVVKQTSTKAADTKRPYRNSRGEQTSNETDWEEKRSREEKLVADIIDRVRRECEAQGSGSATRRGYTRRTTVMNT